MQVPPGLRASVIFSTACLLQKDRERKKEIQWSDLEYVQLDYDGPA